MIVPATGLDGRAFAVTLDEHQRLAAELAAGFGNERFEPLRPRGPLLFAIAHHDAGWEEIDRSPPGDPATSLPCSLSKNPRDMVLSAASRSIDINERHHPFCGLLVSMHQAGLYTGRYGLRSAQPVGDIPPHERASVDAFLRREATRQEELRGALLADPEFHAFVEERALFFNYFRLQFFDRLSLHLNLAPADSLGPLTIDRVPATLDRSVDLHLSPSEGGLTIDEYPFAGDELTVAYWGRPVAPEAGAVAWAERLLAAAPQERRYCLRRRDEKSNP